MGRIVHCRERFSPFAVFKRFRRDHDAGMPYLPWMNRTAARVLGCLVFVGALLPCSARAAEAPLPFEVKVVGQGPPVILIPGLSCSGAIWDSTVRHLEKRFECHVLSLKGFGGVPAMAPLPENFLVAVRDGIISYARSRGLEHPALVGHSLGGIVAMEVAVAAPDLPRALVIVDSVPHLPGVVSPHAPPETITALASGFRKKAAELSHEDMQAVEELVVRTMVNSPEHADMLVEMVGRSDSQTVMQALSELFTVDLREDLSVIRCPVLVIGALADKSVFSSKEEIEGVLRGQFTALPGAVIRLFPDARHFVMYDEPEGFLRAVDEGLAPP